jgi:hypothetical protein
MGLKTRGTEEQMIALILIENEVTVGGRYDHWQDVTGKRYQFPNQYRGKVLTGRPFVCYREARAAWPSTLDAAWLARCISI